VPFAYPVTVHVRKHGPTGYEDYRSYKPWLRDEFEFRCVYCLVRELWYPNRQDAFAVEHARPQQLAPDLVTNYDNLLYACNRCNSWKQTAEVLNPTRAALGDHVQVDAAGTISALTDAGRRLIRVLHLDGNDATEWRRRILDLVRRALAEDPVDLEFLRRWLGLPEDMPDVSKLRPPGGNTRAAGTADSHHERRRRGALPELSAFIPPAPTVQNEPAP
jgi:hypothetical protein